MQLSTVVIPMQMYMSTWLLRSRFLWCINEYGMNTELEGELGHDTTTLRGLDAYNLIPIFAQLGHLATKTLSFTLPISFCLRTRLGVCWSHRSGDNLWSRSQSIARSFASQGGL